MHQIAVFAALMAPLWAVAFAVAWWTVPDLMAAHWRFQKSIATTQYSDEDF